MPELLWLNGHIMPLSEGRISVEDRGFHFADGIYEVVAYYDGHPRMLDDHLDRFEASAAGLLLEPTLPRTQRAAIINDLAHASGFPDAMVYGQLTRGASARNHLFPPATVPQTELWFVRALPRYAPELIARGASLLSQPDERWSNCHLKTISLLPNVLAKERARRAGCFEALLHDEDGLVTEGTSTNAFAVVGGVLHTHPLTRAILPGVTRRLVLRLAAMCGLPVREEPLTIGQFRAADEVFVTSTTCGVMPCTAIDAAPVGTGSPGPITLQLREAWHRAITGIREGRDPIAAAVTEQDSAAG